MGNFYQGNGVRNRFANTRCISRTPFGLGLQPIHHRQPDENDSRREERPVFSELGSRYRVARDSARLRAEDGCCGGNRVGSKGPGNFDVSGIAKRSKFIGRQSAKCHVRLPGLRAAPITISQSGTSARTPHPKAFVFANSPLGNSEPAGWARSRSSRPLKMARTMGESSRSIEHAAANVTSAGALTATL